MIPQSGGPPLPGFFVLRTADITIDDNWHTMGLAGTGSKTIVADNAFVPAHRAVTFAELRNATAPGMRAQTNPLYKQSFLAVLPIAIVAPVVGMAEGALAAFLDMAKVRTSRGALYGGNRKLAELTTVQLRAAEASACIDAARVLMFRDLAEAYEAAARGEAVSMDVRLRNRRDQAFCARLAVQAIDALVVTGGGQGLYLDHPLQRFWRDAHAATLAYQPELGFQRQHVRAIYARAGAEWAVLVHDPEKWMPVFRKDHAPSNIYAPKRCRVNPFSSSAAGLAG